jgi:hypothetical protein
MDIFITVATFILPEKTKESQMGKTGIRLKIRQSIQKPLS